jgi:hypothetical protein
MKNFKNFDFSFDTTAMSDYLNSNADLFLHKIVMDTTEASYYRVLPNIKFGELIPIFDTGSIDTIAFPGTSCAFTGGTVVLEEVELKVCQYNIQKDYCYDELNRTILSIRLAPGSYVESNIPMEEAFMNDISRKANVYMSRKFWGAKSAVDGCSGLIEQLTGATLSGSVVNTTYTAMSASNATSVVDGYITKLPDALKPVTTILALNHSDFQALQLSLRNQNLFHFNPETYVAGEMAIRIPFTNVIAISTELGNVANGVNKAVLTNPENFMYGTDLLSDFQNPIAWYSQDFQQQRIKLAAKLGAAVAFASQVVLAK